jgi:hypothetical protein
MMVISSGDKRNPDNEYSVIGTPTNVAHSSRIMVGVPPFNCEVNKDNYEEKDSHICPFTRIR